MPCGGLTPFLRDYACLVNISNSFVSMPCGGLTPFLHVYWNGYEKGLSDVSMPCGGLTPFLRIPTHLLNIMLHLRVNALWRANSISTLPGCR